MRASALFLSSGELSQASTAISRSCAYERLARRDGRLMWREGKWGSCRRSGSAAAVAVRAAVNFASSARLEVGLGTHHTGANEMSFTWFAFNDYLRPVRSPNQHTFWYKPVCSCGVTPWLNGWYGSQRTADHWLVARSVATQ